MSSLGLADYTSSDDEAGPSRAADTSSASQSRSDSIKDTTSAPIRAPSDLSAAKLSPSERSTPYSSSNPRPATGPSQTPAPLATDCDTDANPHAAANPGNRPSPSPSANETLRALILARDPNTPLKSLPQPGANTSSADPAVTAKIEQLLKLKSEGVHINTRLAGTAALRNPALGRKLLNFAGVDAGMQYESSRGSGPAVEEWMYADRMVEAHAEMRKRREREGVGRPRDFVAASGNGG